VQTYSFDGKTFVKAKTELLLTMCCLLLPIFAQMPTVIRWLPSLIIILHCTTNT